MRVLFILRKRSFSVGGLSRFSFELISRFPGVNYVLSPDSLSVLFKLPFLRFDLIHLSDATLLPWGVLLKYLFRKPLTLTAHGLDLAFPNPFYQLMLKIFLPQTAAIVLDSEPAKKLLKRFSFAETKITVIPPGISLKHFKKEEPLSHPATKGKIVLLTVGNLVTRKGQLWFIERVMSKLPDKFIYLIVGDGPKQREIKGMIKRLKLAGRVFMLGQVSNAHLSYLLRHIVHIYVCPNQRKKGDFEGFGIAVGEAAAFGLPVVASRVDGIPEVIKHGKNGWVVEPEPATFLTALLRLKDSKLRKRLGDRAKKYTQQNFNWEKTIRQYLSLFQEVTGKT